MRHNKLVPSPIFGQKSTAKRSQGNDQLSRNVFEFPKVSFVSFTDMVQQNFSSHLTIPTNCKTQVKLRSRRNAFNRAELWFISGMCNLYQGRATQNISSCPRATTEQIQDLRRINKNQYTCHCNIVVLLNFGHQFQSSTIFGSARSWSLGGQFQSPTWPFALIFS